MNDKTKAPVWLLSALRILVGWHFLYEGIVKLASPSWSAGPYLLESTWAFSSVFRAVASNHSVLSVVDFLNIWGLIFIGAGLMAGLFTRLASWSGAALLMLYYLAHPPFVGIMDGNAMEGNYIWVNKNLIEMVVLILIARVPAGWMFGTDNLIAGWMLRRKEKGESQEVKEESRKEKGINSIIVPQTDNPPFEDLPLFDRRRVLKNLITIPVMGGFAYAALKNFGYESYEEKDLKVNAVSSATSKFANFSKLTDLKEKVPRGRIGNLEVSRLICGGNLIVGYAHARDLIYVSSLLKKYFTQEKIWETIRLCEACGINTVLMRNAPDIVTPLNKYRKQGGKIQWLAATYPQENDLFSNTQLAVDNGADAILIQGNIADTWVSQGRLDLYEKWFAHFQGKGIPLGVGSHELEVVRTMEEKGFPVDFHFKTFHNTNYWSYQADEPKGKVVKNELDNYWCKDPEETAKYMQTVNKPWIAFKILAAGAIKPEDGFKYAFENGADFACVGLFDYQVVDDCNILTGTLKGLTDRTRKFF
jgi:uncharacterized membrane protein YphA (DoxX/SURF4 family)